MKFTTFLGTSALDNIKQLVEEFGVPPVGLEIGVFEGFTTFNLTEALCSIYPEYKHYAIDPFDKSEDLSQVAIQSAEKTFKENLEEFKYKDNIEFIQGYSTPTLLKLINNGVKVDLIYIDGDHRSQTVLEDLVLSFHLLNVGGIIICDDTTTWSAFKLQNTPILAVNSFLHCNYDRVRTIKIADNNQIALQKIKP